MKESISVVDDDYATSHLSELLERVRIGEKITITSEGTPIAKLLPPKRRKLSPEELLAKIEKWREQSKHIRLDGLKIKDLINEGRP
jgi:prevent-host-death family protein